MMPRLLLAAALVWTIAASAPAAARDGLATTMRAVLYEEDLSNPKGNRAEGQITWRVRTNDRCLRAIRRRHDTRQRRGAFAKFANDAFDPA